MQNQIAPRTTTVTLYQGDDYAEFERLRAAVEEAVAADGPRRNGDEHPARAAAREYDEFIAAAAERGRVVTVTAIPRRGPTGFRSLLAAHASRPDSEIDKRYGFNFETMSDDLVPASLPADQFGSIADRDAFLDVLSDADWNRLYDAAITVNQGGAPDPKASLASRLEFLDAQTSDESSKQPQRLA